MTEIGRSEPTDGPEPSEPEDFGVRERVPDAMQIEPARLLANEAREVLRDRGFTDDQIDHWAMTYVTRFGPGDRDVFVAWVEEEQEAQADG